MSSFTKKQIAEIFQRINQRHNNIIAMVDRSIPWNVLTLKELAFVLDQVPDVIVKDLIDTDKLKANKIKSGNGFIYRVTESQLLKFLYNEDCFSNVN